MSKLLIKNARVVNPDSVSDADVLISGDMITRVEPGIKDTEAKIIDATGLHLFPGFIDFHVHLQDRIGDYYIADTYEEGSNIAINNGITTICSFITQKKGMTLKQTVDETVQTYKSKIKTGIHWHLTPTTFSDEDLKEIEELIDSGWNTFKFYTTYKKNGLFAGYEAIETFAQSFKDKDITIMVHCQDDEILNYKHFSLVSEIETEYSQRSERYAVRKIVEIAERNKVHFHIVHLSNANSYIVSDYLTYETCPQYLFLTNDVYRKEDGYKYLCSPYFGDEDNRQRLISLVRDGDIDVLATDHCPFTNSDKASHADNLTKIPNGLCGLDYLVPLAFKSLHDLHNHNLMQLCRMLSYNPAHLIGESSQLGQIKQGFKADLVLVDINLGCQLRSRKNLHNSYQGVYSDVFIKYIIRGGEIIR